MPSEYLAEFETRRDHKFCTLLAILHRRGRRGGDGWLRLIQSQIMGQAAQLTVARVGLTGCADQFLHLVLRLGPDNEIEDDTAQRAIPSQGLQVLVQAE